jgi:hypothetical protein
MFRCRTPGLGKGVEEVQIHGKKEDVLTLAFKIKKEQTRFHTIYELYISKIRKKESTPREGVLG